MAVASPFSRLAAACGLVLLTQVLVRTAWITVVAMSTRPATLTVMSAFQSAVSLTFSGSSDFGYLLVEQGITSSFGTAGQELSWNTNGYSNIQKSPLYTTRSGSFGYPNAGSFFAQASDGYLWSSTTSSGTCAYYLFYYGSYVLPAFSLDRQIEFPVRCINRDFNFLLVQYGIAVNYVGNANATWTTEGSTIIQGDPLFISRNGFFAGGSFDYQTILGLLWSGTTSSGTHAYGLYCKSNIIYPANSDSRQLGFPVRCINRDFNFLLVQYGIAVNYVGDGTNATWATSGYNNVQANPIYTTRSGYFVGGRLSSQASDGDLWSSTANSGTNAYLLGYTSSLVYPAGDNNRQYGLSVRCIAQLF